eukprot:m51a1_g6813 hypothetical protein (952) ;mRNA; r:270415-273998
MVNLRCVGSAVMGNFWRYCLAAFVNNFSGFFYWILMPLVASEMGASSSELAVLSAVYNIVYALCSFLCGVFKVRTYNPGWVLRLSVTTFVFACLFPMYIHSMWAFYVSAIVMAVGRGVYWTIIQTFVSLDAPPARKDFYLSVFSSSWSVGKSVGFVFAGYLKGVLGVAVSWVFVVILSSTQVIYLPDLLPCRWRSALAWLPVNNDGEFPVDKDAELPDDGEFPVHDAQKVDDDDETVNENDVPKLLVHRSFFRRAVDYVKGIFSEDEPLPDPVADRDKSMVYMIQCWFMNFYMNGMICAIVSQFLKYAMYYKISFHKSSVRIPDAIASWFSSSASASSSAVDPESAAEKHAIELFIGIFLCCLFVWQSTLFFVLCRQKWGRRRVLLYFAECLPVAGLVLISLIRDPVALIFVSCLCGFGGGFGILLGLSASVRCSGTAVGINEAILAFGGSIMPLISGAAADLLGDPRAAYLVVAALASVVIVCQEVIQYVAPPLLRIMRRRSEERKARAGTGEYVLMETFSKQKRPDSQAPALAALLNGHWSTCSTVGRFPVRSAPSLTAPHADIASCQYTSNTTSPAYGAIAAASDYVEGHARTPATWVSPYLAEIGLIGLLRGASSLGLQAHYVPTVRLWIEWYLRHLNTASDDPGGVECTVFDYNVGRGQAEECERKDIGGKKQCSYDSSDSYAALFLAVVRDYLVAGGDVGYVRTIEGRMECVFRVISSTLSPSNLTWACPWYKACYLMDNVEVWYGLDAYAETKTRFLGAKDVTSVVAIRDSIASAIESALYKPQRTEYVPEIGEQECNWDVWYADATANVWPALWSYTQPPERAKTVFAKLIAAHGKKWEALAVSDFPWTSVAVAAVRSGDCTSASAFLSRLNDVYGARHWEYPYSVDPRTEAGWHAIVLSEWQSGCSAREPESQSAGGRSFSAAAAAGLSALAHLLDLLHRIN